MPPESIAPGPSLPDLPASDSTPAAAASPAYGLQVKQVSFAWDADRPVLKGCDFAVPRGQFWMLLGSNGSGKSTLLKLITGLLPLQSGSIELLRPTGFVFQNPDHQLVMPTVGADVAFGLVAEKLSPVQVRQRVRESLEAVNLGHLERRPIYALSGGQKQRVAIAGAIARHSQLLLLDEPTALLDPESQIDLVKQVRALVHEKNLTALWVTHRLGELDYCDGAFLLQNGTMVDQGDPQRLKAQIEQNQIQPVFKGRNP